MKGVIWKIDGRKSVVLFQNGDFRAIATPPDARVGMTVTVSYNKKRIFLFAGALCAVVIAAVLPAVFYFSPAGYFDCIIAYKEDRRIIVECAVNHFDRIFETRIFSAEKLFSESLPELKHKRFDDGYAAILKSASVLPVKAKKTRILIRIAHKDLNRAEKIKERIIHLNGELKTATGRALPLTFEIERIVKRKF
ncbi:MAG: anti-sigma factor domain-containing protein [Spirochaetaceae bacterium]|jgi:hypothetical protein|nr:anti-sigma factor domain-containing protein [Spirochaetaceae bacterium]